MSMLQVLPLTISYGKAAIYCGCSETFAAAEKLCSYILENDDAGETEHEIGRK